MPVTYLCPRCRQPQPCKAHGREARPNAYQRGYGGARWIRERAQFLHDNPTCRGPWSLCEKAGQVTVATDMDHDIPVTGKDDPKFYGGKFNSLCASCHKAKTKAENATRRNPVKSVV